jgi:Cu2+-exporting ATPase
MITSEVDIIARSAAPEQTNPAAPSSSAHEVRCAHCGDRVPRGLVEHDAPLQFCCAGCRTVYQVIHGCGLDRYYAIRREANGEITPARITSRRYGEFDDATFRRLYVREIGNGFASVELFLPAAHCAACVWLVEKLPRVAAGVIEARLDLRRALVRIVWDERATTLAEIARALDSLGYAPAPARSAGMREARRAADRRQIISLGVAGACAGNVMLLALAMYSGMFDAIEPQYLRLFRWVSMAISLVSLAWPGRVFFRGAWSALRTRTLHLDVPIALGLGAGAVWGAVSTIRGSGEIYFDSLSVLVFALLLGRFIQSRQQRWAADAVELLFSLTPTSARVVGDDGAAHEAAIEAVQPGMIVEVRAGDSIPVDGVVTRGSSSIDQSMLTGESRPVDVREGMGVAAGAVNLSSTLRLRVEATGEDTRVGRLMRMVEECAQRRAPIVRLADRIAGWFVAAMLLLALATAGIWMMLDPSRAVDNAIALLIVTCPCALGLATPLAMTVAIGSAARNGALIKGGDVLEKLATPHGRGVGTILLDKTGTITCGRLSAVKYLGDESIKPMISAVETHSSHPIALALARDFAPRAGDSETNLDARWMVSDVRQTLGAGIEASVISQGENGRRSMHVVIGSPRFVRSLAARSKPELEWAERDLACECEPLTPVLVAMDGEVVAAIGLGDPIRDDAPGAVALMRRAGWRVRIVSGDRASVVRSVGARLGLLPDDCVGDATPEQKLAIVRQTLAEVAAGRASGSAAPVIMVGDGVNDAAALAAASVGIAVHGGAEASLAAADVYLNRPGLLPIVELLDAARRTRRVVRRNLAASLFYNTVAAALAMTGVINPLIAAVLMPVSSLSVVAISVGSRTFALRRDQRTTRKGDD